MITKLKYYLYFIIQNSKIHLTKNVILDLSRLKNEIDLNDAFINKIISDLQYQDLNKITNLKFDKLRG